MGDDLAGMQEWIATGWKMKEASGSRNVRGIVTPRRRGTDEPGQVEFTLTSKRGHQSAVFLAREPWDGDADEG